MNHPINRRHVLIAGAGVVVASSGGLWLALQARQASDWIEAVVRAHLPRIRLDEQTLNKFAARLASEPTFKSRKLALALDLDGIAPALVRIAPEINRKLASLERLVISEFLLSSNFFRVVDPRRETIVCGERLPVCGNPFAVFRAE
jgi:hypothetical protein